MDMVGFLARTGNQFEDFAGMLNDFTGSGINTLGQLADLAGDHGKTLARIARPGGLDPGIKRQQMSLKRNVFNKPAGIVHRLGALTCCETTPEKTSICVLTRLTRSCSSLS